MKKNIKKKTNKEINYEGLVSLGELQNGLRTANIISWEDLEIEPLNSRCKVQIMRDGNIYITQLPKRFKNRPIFREDNCSLSLGRDGKYYFVFTMPEQLVEELPRELVRQASNIAQKVLRSLTPNPSPKGEGNFKGEGSRIIDNNNGRA